MDLKSFLRDLPTEEARVEFASACGTTLGHLRNTLYGLRSVAPETCVLVERATARAVMRWDLRSDDWHRIWPELIGALGAPAVPTPEAEATNAE